MDPKLPVNPFPILEGIEKDIYLVEGVVYTYSRDGIRQNITIGRKISI